MYTGALPATTLYGTWSENIEVWSVDDDTLYDLSSVTEVTLRLRDRITHFDELTLTMSNGDIILIPTQGIIQWRMEAVDMGSLEPKIYEVILTMQDATDTVPLIIGSVAIVE